MHQKDVGALVNATISTVTNWEKNRTNPRLYLMPKIISFLGYDPIVETTLTPGQQIKQYRQKHGLSIKKLAKTLGVDPTTQARWEKGETKHSRTFSKLEKFLRTFIG